MDVTTGGWIVLAVAVLRAIEAVARLFWKKRNKQKYNQLTLDRRKANPNDKPGKAQICIDNGNRLTEIETNLEYIKEDIRDLKRPGRG